MSTWVDLWKTVSIQAIRDLERLGWTVQPLSEGFDAFHVRHGRVNANGAQELVRKCMDATRKSRGGV